METVFGYNPQKKKVVTISEMSDPQLTPCYVSIPPAWTFLPPDIDLTSDSADESIIDLTREPPSPFTPPPTPGTLSCSFSE